MITFLRGEVVSVSESRLVMDVNHVGFQIGISARDAAKMPPVGEQVLIYTYMSVREDAISLFGFLSEDELALYKLMINVNGIGPKAALSILSVLSANEVRLAVISDDEKSIAKAPGVGAKTAKKMILELKDKIKTEDVLAGMSEEEGTEVSGNPQFEANKKEAIEVLVALGYSRSEALRSVRKAKLTEDMDSDQILTAALSDR